jgi:hypothetical protein
VLAGGLGVSAAEDYARRDLVARDPTLLQELEKVITVTAQNAPATELPDRAPLFSHNSLFSQPVLHESARHGLAGTVVNTVLPHSEADAASLLLHFLTGYGSLIGRSAHCKVESTLHHSNLYFACVGQTSKSRKGTSWNRVRDLFARVDPEWVRERLQTGLSSGEGLIAAVADNGDVPTDRRLLVIRPELASTLKVMSREGNTLSPIIREAFDSGTLGTMVKRDRLSVNNAHIGIIGHITQEELKRCLTATEAANGFANRFLWAISRRSKCLPEGGSLTDAELDALAERLRPAIAFGRSAGLLQRDKAAKQLWATIYPELSEGGKGMLGAVTSRAEAQVLRLSMLYALLDCSSEIRVPHLAAAIAVWDYCYSSAELIFGDTLGDPVADMILTELRKVGDSGLTRSQISQLFGRHKDAADINRALNILTRKALAIKDDRETDGRSAEVWFAKEAKKAK